MIGTLRKVGAYTDVLTNGYAELFHLLTHQVHEFGTGNVFGMTREILNGIRDGQLSTRLNAFVEYRRKISTARIDGGCVAGRSRANDKTTNMFHRCYWLNVIV